MRTRYIAARRSCGGPSRHLTARRLRRRETRFYRAAMAGAMLAASMLMYVLR